VGIKGTSKYEPTPCLRPENLELWLKSHPPGQRVDDLADEDIWSGTIPSYLKDCPL